MHGSGEVVVAKRETLAGKGVRGKHFYKIRGHCAAFGAAAGSISRKIATSGWGDGFPSPKGNSMTKP